MDHPLVLAGPIVRRVDAKTAAIWVALSSKSNVELRLWPGAQFAGAQPGIVESGDTPVVTGSTDTQRIGPNLHIAVVQAAFPGDTPGVGPGPANAGSFLPARLYSYDLVITPDGQPATGLKGQGLLSDEQATARLEHVDASAPLSLALGYREGRLPSFATCPSTLEQLRLVHGSCRKTNGPGPDAFAWLDDLIEGDLDDPVGRPHQAFLTGDQIYADDVSTSLLSWLNFLGGELLGGREMLPVAGQPVESLLRNFPPMRREMLLFNEASFTSTSGENHLMTLGEYCAMYLCAWSPVVWGPLPKSGDLFGPLGPDTDAAVKDKLTPWERCYGGSPTEIGSEGKALQAWEEDKCEAVRRERERTIQYRDSVPKVRRALANVSTYMIFDDHEVTDDWNLTQQWVDRVLASTLGRAVVRNGIAAYALFQAWGNDPETFSKGDGKKLLVEVGKMVPESGGTFPQDGPAGEVEKLLGMVGSGSSKIPWHYQVQGPLHRVVALDTRMNRAFPRGRLAPPQLVGNLSKQLAAGPFADGTELLLLISAAPVLGPPLLDRIGQTAMIAVADLKAARAKTKDPCDPEQSMWGFEVYDAEGWASDDVAVEELLVRAADYGQVVILSGDVHYGLSMEMDFWKKKGTTSASSRFVQLTASPQRNGFKPIVEAIKRSTAVGQRLQRLGLPAFRYAWKSENADPVTVPTGKSLPSALRSRLRETPKLVPGRGWPAGTTLKDTPDWRWRMDLLRDPRPDLERPDTVRIPSVLSQDIDPSDPVTGYRALAARHAATAAGHFDHLRQIVFRCNLGVVTFPVINGTPSVRHTLLSQAGDDLTRGVPNTVHEARITPTTDSPPGLEGV